MANGQESQSPTQPDKWRIAIYPASLGPVLWWDALRATIVGNWEEPSGESRLKHNHLRRAWKMPSFIGFPARSCVVAGLAALALSACASADVAAINLMTKDQIQGIQAGEQGLPIGPFHAKKSKILKAKRPFALPLNLF